MTSPPEPRRSVAPPLALIFSITLTGIMGNSLIAPVLPDVLDELAIDDRGAGFVIAAVALPGIVVAPLIGFLADRLGRRAVVVPCLALFGIAGLAVAAAPSFSVLLAARIAQGVGAAGLINLAVVIIGDHWSGRRRTALLGRNTAMLTVGLASFPLVSGVIAELASWRISLLPQAFALLVAVWAWGALDPVRPEVVPALRDQLGGVGEVVRRPTIITTLVVGVVLFVLIFGLFLATLPLHLEREFGLGAGARGLMLSIPAVTASLVAFNLGRITDRVGTTRVMIASAALYAVAFALMGAAPLIALVVVAVAIYGIGEGALIPILQDVAVSEAPDQHRGGVVAVWVGAVRFGQTIGPLIAAGVLAATSTGTTLLLGSLVAALLVVGIAVGPLARRRTTVPAA